MFKLADTENLVVKTQPTVTFSNGMVLWLAEKDKEFVLTESARCLLYEADRYIRNIKVERDA